MAYEIALGIGIFSFLLFIFISNLGEEHTLLKFLTAFFAIGILILLPKVYIEDQCFPVVANETVSGNITEFDYTMFCETTHHSSGVTFQKTANWFFICFVTYIFMYLMYFIFFKKIGKEPYLKK